MKILVTGAKGMVGTALVNNLKNLRDNKNRTRPNILVEEIFEYDLNSTQKELEDYCKKADFVFNLAGVNRPENQEDFMKGNFGFASQLLDTLKKYNNKAAIMLSSSLQATDKFKYTLKMNIDDRGSFTELVHTEDCGQVSINISKPGITKGQHWHNSKWELFIVVAGHGLIQERNINTGETVEFEVTGDKIEAIHMIPGWTHNIINLSKTENLVTVMTCNEVFNPEKPDTFFEPV